MAPSSEERVIRVRGIDHVVLRVRDLDESLRFYTEVLDAREERRLESLGLVQLRAGGQLIDLVTLDGELGRAGGAPPVREGRNLDHLAVQLEAFDEAALRAWLSAHGVEPGEVGRRYGAGGYGPAMYVRDPDGNVVELKGPPDDGPG